MARKIQIQLKGAAKDSQHVRLSEFIAQLNSFYHALANTERLVTGREKPALYYRIIDLTHSSPATVLLEATPYKSAYDPSNEVVDKLFSGLTQVQETGQISEDYDWITLDSYKTLCAALHKNITEVKLSSGQFHVEITTQLESKIDLILGAVVTREGSFTGMLEAINLHNRANKFFIYPMIGPSKVICHFPDSMLPKAIAAISRHVQVSGQLVFKQHDYFPHRVEVADLEIFPEEQDLPTLGGLRGLAPDATDDLDSVAFVRSLRDAKR